MKLLLLHQQTGDQKYQDKCRYPQSSQAKRKAPTSTKMQPKRQKTAPPSSPPPVLPIHVESSPSSPEIQTQQALSPPQPASPQPVLQLQEAPADVPEQITDPADPIIPSAVSSEQTSTTTPQGKVLSITPLTMNFLQIIITFIISSVDVIPSATPADQPVVPSASTSQRREIALKQVSYLVSILFH